MPLKGRKLETVGVCLPSLEHCRPSQYGGLREAFNWLSLAEIPYRIVPEGLLTTDWDGLDDLIVVPNGVSLQGKRKLQGFCAAGGTIVSLGHEMGLAQEMQFDDWKKSRNKV